MKKIAIVFLVALSSCATSPEQKAKKLIKDELNTSLHDAKSYESVEFSKIDTLYSSLTEDPKISAVTKRIDSLIKVTKEFSDDLDIYGRDWYNDGSFKRRVKENDVATALADSLIQLKKKLIVEFTPIQTGWKMTHKYRAKNKLGNYILSVSVFEFDSSISKITGVREIGD